MLVQFSNSPICCSQASGTKKVSDWAGGWELCVSGVKHHADIFGYDCGLGAVLHLQLMKEEEFLTLILWSNSHITSDTVRAISVSHESRHCTVPLSRQRGSCRSSPHMEWLGLVTRSCAWSYPKLPRNGRKSWGDPSKKSRKWISSQTYVNIKLKVRAKPMQKSIDLTTEMLP